MTLRSSLAAAALLLLSGGAGQAAYIHEATGPDGGPRIVIEGEIADGDEARFEDMAAVVADAVVVLTSPGGDLQAGITIGRTIRARGLATLVEDGEECASACALAWLAGTPRMMEEGASIGFHAAYTDDSGEMVTNAPGNALVGAYVSQLGFPEQVIIYVTGALPEEMQWLTPEDAEEIGITVDHQEAAIDPAPTAEENLYARAVAAAERYFEASSEENSDTISFLHRTYAPRVMYYGKEVSRDTAMLDKISFVKRWPERRYAIQPDSVAADCDGKSCLVEGIYDWWAYSEERDSTSAGTAEFRFKFAALAPLVIALEDGTVIARQVADGREEGLTAE